ncbi:MAG: alanine--tRNA ligase [Anaerolineae bacterium]|nr:alanine--tRNA ligase [Anaerolineae bacterium]MDW8173221.1 alanine--tRNA ligase [Anaerolineae bacterium]
MKSMTSAEVRQAFLDFFIGLGHRHVASSSLVPANDPTLLFTNSGMVQFKDVFLGLDKRDYKRATTAQKSMRVSGKHNDLENVGPSPRHHTFFEMLGNFSFGDYFKRDAIHYAWKFITEVLEMPEERLAVSVYEKDDDAYRIWHEDIGLPATRIARLGPKSNFWQMGETGPCGPCSEIFWDKHPEQGEDQIVPSLLADEDRMLEFWNLVFMQFNRTQPDPIHSGAYDVPLPAPSVDTGMGLERIVSIIQGVEANYDTDLFLPIIATTQRLSGQTDEEVKANYVAYRVIADHIRAAVFLIADGVLPGAKGRDAVCRLVIRRAARFGRKIGFHEPFLSQVAQTVIEQMGGHYTELQERSAAIQRAITLEEERFLRTLERGVAELEAMMDALPPGGTISGEQAFYLKATLGLPIQVTKDIAEERGYTVDMAAFHQAEEAHSLVSGAGQAMGTMESGEFYSSILHDLQGQGLLGSDGVRYDPYTSGPIQAQALAFLRDGQRIERPIVGDKVEVILDQTQFYVEAGGQVSDTGLLRGTDWTIEVEDMKKPVVGLIVHVGEVVEGSPALGPVSAEVDLERRAAITRHHSGTHLLHAALRNHLGTGVQQRGSLVAPDRLRFDFSYNDKVTPSQLRAIEQEINRVILADYPVRSETKSLDQARKEGAMALFGEKYGETVRTIIIEKNGHRYSYELCGGVHVPNTAEIGAFVFTSEGAVSAGIRRVEALAGQAALDYIQERLSLLQSIGERLQATPDQIIARLEALQNDLAAARKTISQLQTRLAKTTFDELMTSMSDIGGKSALIAQVDNVSADALREMADWFRDKVKTSGVIILGSNSEGKPSLLVGLTDDLVKSGLKAGELIKPLAAIIGGGGGGRPNLAQAGGKDPARLPEALKKARELLA